MAQKYDKYRTVNNDLKKLIMCVSNNSWKNKFSICNCGLRLQNYWVAFGLVRGFCELNKV